MEKLNYQRPTMEEYYLLPAAIEDDEQNSSDSMELSSLLQTRRKRRRSLFIYGVAVGIISQFLVLNLATFFNTMTGKHNKEFATIFFLLSITYISVQYVFVGQRNWKIFSRLMRTRNKDDYDEEENLNISSSLNLHLCSWCIEHCSFNSGQMIAGLIFWTPMIFTDMMRADSSISRNIGIGTLFLVGNMILHRFLQNMEEKEEASSR